MSSIAFIMLGTQSKATIDRVFDEALPYMHKSVQTKLSELFAVNRSALSFVQISRCFGSIPSHVPIPPSDTFTVAIKVARIFRNADVSYAIGGSLACSLWSIPRATMDVDMNCFVSASSDNGVDAVLDLLENNGVVFCDKSEKNISKGEARRLIRDSNTFYGLVDKVRVDLFFSDSSPIDLTRIAEQRCLSVDVFSEKISFLDAESIAIFKLMWKRSKDVFDLENLFCVRRATLDLDYIERILLQQLNEDDDSLKLFYILKKRYGKAL